ncbi:MAG: sialate O-acetylesterase, partial [Victivallaceae bacterium]
MMRKFLWCGVLIAAAAVLRADVSLPKIFGDNMVLQQGKTLPVWGKADPGEKVAVTFGDAKAETVTGPDGRFRVDLPAQKTAKDPRVLTVSGKNKIEYKNVIVGNVWIASGQSNMEFSLSRSLRSDEVIPRADYPEIRLFQLKKACAFEPKDDCEGVWQVCSPQTVPTFSAVAYFFGRELYEKTGVPVGLIGTYWGGSNAKAWTSREVLAAKFPHYAKELA